MAVVIVLAGAVAFQYAHWREHQVSDEMGMNAAYACATMLELNTALSNGIDPNSKDYADAREAMRRLCRLQNMDYMYAYSCDVEAGTVTYLFCVADDDENDARMAQERGYGTVVSGLSNQELAALDGHETKEALEIDNDYGHMLAWFSRVDGWDGNVLAGADYSVQEQRDRVFHVTLLVVMLIALAFLVLLFVQLYVLRVYIFSSLDLISARMKAFSAEKAGEFEPLDIATRDEISDIADAFTGMATEIAAYLKDIDRMTSERVQASVEMDVARRIQLGLVPERTNLEAPGFDVSALARTAREVGGDFYDCFMLEGGRVAIVVGDVSGKGMAASLFMSMVKTMIHDSLAFGETPAATLNAVNERLRQANPEGMFVTVFAAVYDPPAGTVRFANAGHMPPLVVGKDVRVLDADPGVLLGLFDDAGLLDGTVHLEAGEALLVYTDGVTEAVNPENAFFGEDRLVKTLQAHLPYAAVRTLVDEAVCAVDEFAESREQFDDLTLLALMSASKLQELPVDISSLSSVRKAIMQTGFDDALKLKACLVCEEMLANVVSYSKAESLWFEVAEEQGALHMVLADDGQSFDPLKAVLAKKDFEDLDEGGMGIGLVRQLASDLHYRREANRNILVMILNAG